MKFFATITTALFFLAAPVAALDLETMSDAERQLFRDEVRAYLLENPEVLMEAIGVLEQRQAQDQVTNDQDLIISHAEPLFNDGHSYEGGNPDGDIVMVEFSDYKCGFCKRAHPEVNELVRSDGNIKLIVKEFPILGEQSALAARFAVAVLNNTDPDTYVKINDALMAFRGEISTASLERLAGSFNLDTPTIMAAMDGPEVAAVIGQNHALGQSMAINGTPSFVIGDQMFRGYVPLEDMRKIVAQLRADTGN